MSRYKMKIELLSDLCVSDGGNYNSMIDNDVCYDRYGFPYIPAKRIRGCLKECCQELNDWCDNENELIDIDKIFGKEGEAENRASLVLENAYLEDYENNKAVVLKNKGHLLVHSQNVLDSYTYIRTQTSIDYETGVADDTSLRTTRVIDRGLVFIANVQLPQKYSRQLEDACTVLRHIGVARTRGFGEVKVSLINDALSKNSSGHEECIKDKKLILEDEEGTKDKKIILEDGKEKIEGLEYTIKLLEPVIIKSVNGGEAKTKDYIEGSTVLGIIGQRLKESKEDYSEFISLGRLRCSNAYIEIDGKRSAEAPGYLYNIKNNDKEFVNKIYENDESKKQTEKEQLNKFKHSYVVFDTPESGEDSLLKVRSVETEERYHHRRPEDKSIGRADANDSDNSNFYSMESISEGQEFKGFITGSADQIRKVYDMLDKEKECRIGYSRSSEYGKAEISVRRLEINSETQNEKDSFVVRLISPTIIYSDKAIASSDPDDLLKEILAVQGLSLDKVKMKREKDINDKQDSSGDNEYTQKYLKYTTSSGFNVTWGRRKPTIPAFEQGTAFKIVLDGKYDLKEGTAWIGERNIEGYGECEFIALSKENPGIYRGKMVKVQDNDVDAIATIEIGDNPFLKMLCRNLLDSFIRKTAVDNVTKKEWDQGMKATVSNMLLMAEENDKLDGDENNEGKEGVHKAVNERYKARSETKHEKKKNAEKIIKDVKSVFVTEADKLSVVEAFCKRWNIDKYVLEQAEIEGLKMMYLKEYLTQIKYVLRGKEQKEKEGTVDGNK